MNPLFSNFLNKRISKSCNITNRCMFNELFLLFTNWLSKKEDINKSKDNSKRQMIWFLSPPDDK